MKRVGWVIVGRGGDGETWHTFLDTAALTQGQALRKWCPSEMNFRERRKHWSHLRKTGLAKLVRIHIEEV